MITRVLYVQTADKPVWVVAEEQRELSVLTLQAALGAYIVLCLIFCVCVCVIMCECEYDSVCVCDSLCVILCV